MCADRVAPIDPQAPLPGTGPLEAIARKEQEIRARILAARGEAERVVAAAEREAAAILRVEAERAQADARDLLARETELAREDAQRAIAAAEVGARALATGAQRLERAVALVVDAVVPRAAAAVSRKRR